MLKVGAGFEGGQVQGEDEEDSEDKRKNKKIAAAETERTRTGIVITIPFCDGDAIWEFSFTAADWPVESFKRMKKIVLFPFSFLFIYF